jgi:hypothetical protein
MRRRCPSVDARIGEKEKRGRGKGDNLFPLSPFPLFPQPSGKRKEGGR